MKNHIPTLFDEVLESYPPRFQAMIRPNRSRLLWQLKTAVDKVPEGGSILDIGAGVVPFMLVLARMGYKTAIMDDFGDNTYPREEVDVVLRLFNEAGVQIIRGDAFEDPQNFPLKNMDMMTTHDSMEHWHNSPKTFFHVLWGRLNPNGLFWIGVPNCVNLRKRITVPLGYGKWSAMKNWYEEPIFRGHVREPDVGDLAYIARDLKASKFEIVGKNWLGYRHPKSWVRTITPLIDKPMQLRPSLCSDIYLFAWK